MSALTRTRWRLPITEFEVVIPEKWPRTEPIVIQNTPRTAGIHTTPSTRLVVTVWQVGTRGDTGTNGHTGLGVVDTLLDYVIPDETTWTGDVVGEDLLLTRGVHATALAGLVGPVRSATAVFNTFTWSVTTS